MLMIKSILKKKKIKAYYVAETNGDRGLHSQIQAPI